MDSKPYSPGELLTLHRTDLGLAPMIVDYRGPHGSGDAVVFDHASGVQFVVPAIYLRRDAE